MNVVLYVERERAKKIEFSTFFSRICVRSLVVVVDLVFQIVLSKIETFIKTKTTKKMEIFKNF